MLSRCCLWLLAMGLLVAGGALADPALYWGSQTAFSGDFAAGPDLVGPDGVPVSSGGSWLVQLVDLGSGDVLASAPAGAIMDIGQGVASGVLYATLPEAGPWRGRSLRTRVFNAESVAAATHWALLSATTVLGWDTVPSAPATFTYNAGRVAQGDWHEVDNRLAPTSQTTCSDGTAALVVPLNLAVDQDLSSLSFVLTFDPARLRAVGYGAAGRTAVAAQADGVDQAGGRITFRFSQPGGGTAIAAGSGAVAEAVFELQPGVGAGTASLNLGSVEAWTTALVLKALTTHAGGIEIANCSLYTLTYLAGDNGAIDGPTPQTRIHGSDGAAVTAVAAFGYVFAGWSDGSSANPRQDLQVTASQTLTARFEPSGPVPPHGSFLARVSATDSLAQRLWDLSGTYATTVAGQPLVMSLVHDPMGRLSGTATYAVGKASAVSLSVRGTVKGSPGGGVTLRGFLAGANPERTVSVALALRLTVDATGGQLVGPINGSVASNGLSTPVAADVALPIAAPMDGTWTLRLQLDRAGRAVTGTARLTLANGVGYAYAVRGKATGQVTVLSLAGDPTDPLAKAVRIRVGITPLAGGWARLEMLAGSGYGQALVW